MLYEYAEDCHDSPHSLRKLIRWMPKQPKGGHYKGLDWRELPALFKDLHRLQNTAAHNWRVNPERRAQIVKLNEFMSQKAIAATLGVAQSLVYHYLNSEDKAGKTEINYTRIKAFMLEFIFLTGALRVGSTVALKWKYVNEENKLLVIPRAEMKIDDEERGDFVIPLVPRAMEILEEMKAYKRGDYIFPGKGRRKPIEARRCARGTPYDPNAEGSGLVPTILWSFLKKDLGRDITVHGARRTIKNWCTTQQWVSDLTAELALDHKYEPPRRKYRYIAIEFTLGNVYGTKIENVYRDEQLIEERRKMLEALANYCLGQEETNVIQLQARVPRKTA
jgi:integrase